MFSSLIINAADLTIPKFANSHTKSYPAHIIELIKLRRKIRKNKKGKSLEKSSVINTEYNRLTGLIKKAIKDLKWKSKYDLNKAMIDIKKVI